jgi:hypothetical protein
MTIGIIITENSVSTKYFDTGVTHTEIHEIIGGWFDCVRTDSLIGYVHDEGILLGLPINPIATALFGRVLCGTCVVFGAMSSTGEYDGYDHSVPARDLDIISHHYDVLRMVNEAVRDRV